MKNWSFAILEKQKDVSPRELMATLSDYAREWAISSEVVIALINRVSLLPRHKINLLRSARLGVKKHTLIFRRKKIVGKEAMEYQRVVDYLSTF